MKSFRPLLSVFAFCAFLLATIGPIHAADAAPPVYIALFRLTIGTDERLQDFQLVKVIDLLSGTNKAASVELPQAFLNQARKKVEDEHFKPKVVDGKPTSTLTTFMYSPAANEKIGPPGISFGALNGSMNSVGDLRVLGQNGQVSTFVANFGGATFFVSYYALPLPKRTKEQREAIVEAELQRSAANVQNAEILSRKNLSTDSQTIMEFTCKSPRNKALTIRSRYLCKDDQMVAFSAITPDGLSVEEVQSFERLFEVFRFRE